LKICEYSSSTMLLFENLQFELFALIKNKKNKKIKVHIMQVS